MTDYTYTFNNVFFNFTDELLRSFPEQEELIVEYSGMAKKAVVLDKNYLVKLFGDIAKYKKEIVDRDTEFFIKEISTTGYKDLFDIVVKSGESIQEPIWEYLELFIRLYEKIYPSQ